MYFPFLSNKNTTFFSLVFNKEWLHFPLTLHQAGFTIQTLNTVFFSEDQLKEQLFHGKSSSVITIKSISAKCLLRSTADMLMAHRDARGSQSLTVVRVEDLSDQQQEPLLRQTTHVKTRLPDKSHPQLLLQVTPLPRQLKKKRGNESNSHQNVLFFVFTTNRTE